MTDDPPVYIVYVAATSLLIVGAVVGALAVIARRVMK